MGTAEIPFSSVAGAIEPVMSVSINPGATALTVMPRDATSRAIAFVRPTSPALLEA